MARRSLRYRGPVKIVETTGTWGVYAGERIVLGDGTSLDDDLGRRIRHAFGDPDPNSEAFTLDDVEIVVRRRRR